MEYRIRGEGWEVSSPTPGTIMGQAAIIAQTDGICPVEVRFDSGGGYVSIVGKDGEVIERRPLDEAE